MPESNIKRHLSSVTIALPSRRTSSLWLLLLAVLWNGIQHPQASAETRKPNIILIMADDVSWEAFGCYGAQDYKTPRLDRMAEQGLRFTHCYSTPICTTSRVKLMTGKYNFRNYTHFGYLHPDEKTFGNLLQDAGYQTAIAGKWQLNGLSNTLPRSDDSTRPHAAGFDEYMLWQLTKPKARSAGGGERFWSPVFEHNGKLLTAKDNDKLYGPDLLADFVCDFMSRNRDEPFFVYYPMVLVHDPFVPTPDTVGDGDRSRDANKAKKSDHKKNFVAMVNYMDKIVGRIVDKTEALGIADDTVIMFTADNGTNTGITSNWNGRKIRGGKAGMTDMGTHVPFIAYQKGQTPVGQTVDDLIEFTDFYPTIAELAGVELTDEDPQDGVSFFPQLRGEKGTPRDWVLCHYQPYWNKKPGQFIRNQQHKLYRDGRFYDIGSGDLDEKLPIERQSTSSEQLASWSALQEVLKLAPPAPEGHGDRNTVERPVFPTWRNLFDPND